jgi:Cu-Zn family superoxide dismutase
MLPEVFMVKLGATSEATLFGSLVLMAAVMAAQASDTKPTTAGGAVTDHAVTVLQAAGGGTVRGTLHFRQGPDGVRVQGTITGLPAGPHGFHIHEIGDCSAADFASAGGHFNPTQEPHGAPDAPHRHEGDLGNIQAGTDGTARVDYTDRRLDFAGTDSVLGRGVIVHEKADDLKTQPTGDAGGRLACGAIGVAKSE